MAFRTMTQWGLRGVLSLAVSATTFQSCGRLQSQDDEASDQPGVEVPTQNIVKAEEGQSIQRKIGDEVNTFDIVSKSKKNSKSLVIGFPKKLLGHGFLFGASFVDISHSKDLTPYEAMQLGDLKITSVDPIHVRPTQGEREIEKGKGKIAGVTLIGCGKACNESSKLSDMIHLPTVKNLENAEFTYIDFSELGKRMNLVRMVDPRGSYIPYRVVSADVTMVDFSSSTLVFDVTHVLDDGIFSAGQTKKQIKIVGRWYLKLESEFQSNFTSREATEGVGFFMTSRNEKAKIRRFSLGPNPNGKKPIYYYVKNVPEKHKDAFKDAFAQWNALFKEMTGEEKLEYTFVDAKDPNNGLILTGDPRYNVIEWDQANLASYAGLGPSQSSQSTGQTYAGQVLIQGPALEKSYKAWFGEKSTNKAEAQKELLQNLADLERGATKGTWSVTVGAEQQIAMNVYAQDPTYSDAATTRKDFFEIPDGITYDSYIKSYFTSVVTHEIGHNLGLRHNFRGSVYADKEKKIATASVMEYLDRSVVTERGVGVYDKMAIAYGYQGKQPTVKNMFCTDQEVPSVGDPFVDKTVLSAECSRSDATDDPFGYVEMLATKTAKLLVNAGSKEAPQWTWSELNRFADTYAQAMLFYASSAEDHSAKWTNFHKKNSDRPEKAEDISNFVMLKVNDLACAKTIRDAVEEKSTPAAKEAAQKNLKAFKTYLTELGTYFGVSDLGVCDDELDTITEDK